MSPRPLLVHAFSRPLTAFSRGHRGIDLAGLPGQQIRAVDAGTVTHVGVVAGRGTVTVSHPSGLRSTYEPVSALVARGEPVGRGTVLGVLETRGSHCAPRPCLHLGALKGPAYLDPLPLLSGSRVRLLPLH